MLIRIVGVPDRNSEGADKIIFVEGLPDSTFFEEVSGWEYSETEFQENGHPKKYFKTVSALKSPWEIDYPENLPKDIRKKFTKDRTIYELVVEHVEGERPERVLLPRNLSCVKVDYQSSKGEAAWKKIERTIEKETPRDAEVPVPALVGDRRTWTLDIDDVPQVRLSKVSSLILPPAVADVIEAAPTVTPPPAEANPLECCDKTFSSKQALRMHRMKKHAKEPQGVGA